MRLWARLTWQAHEPEVLAAELARRLAAPVRPGGLAPGAWLLDLGTSLLEVRPWIRETSSDRPVAAGRLVLEPVPDGEDPPAHEGGVPPSVSLLGLGWATVELDRAEQELGMWLGPRAGAPTEDEHLGAVTRLREGGGLPGTWTVLLEPSREGRAAASLARDSEGPCALYLQPAAGLEAWLAAAGVGGRSVGRPRRGPFGRQLLLAGAPAGPHVIVTEGRPPVSGAASPGTIAP
jgi:hypothetical protein